MAFLLESQQSSEGRDLLNSTDIGRLAHGGGFP
jgi:hypothetical protein